MLGANVNSTRCRHQLGDEPVVFAEGRRRWKPSFSNIDRVPLWRKGEETLRPVVSSGELSTVPQPRRAISCSAPLGAAPATPSRRLALVNDRSGGFGF